MEHPVENYWQIKLERVAAALTANSFDAHIATDMAAARDLVMEKILPACGAKTASFGGSVTVFKSGLYEAITGREELEVIDTIDPSVAPEEKMERRRQALLADFFVTGTNAVTEGGQLVNLDMIGNRVGALTFGPKKVVLVAGRNKIVPDLDTAMDHIKSYVAPANAMRLDMKTPCVKTGRCEACKSPARICNTWTITEKSFPKKRVSVVLVNADAGL